MCQTLLVGSLYTYAFIFKVIVYFFIFLLKKLKLTERLGNMTELETDLIFF